MINSKYIIEAAHCVDGKGDLASDARARYKDTYTSRTARRMTHLGMMTGLCLKKLHIDKATPVIYASSYAESQSLEAFLDSFPEASPLHFQRSIHPSAVEQTFIASKQPIDNFYPITSDFNLTGQALENGLISNVDRVAIIAGEERGTWLCKYDLASADSFAYGITLKKEGEGVGFLTLEESISQETKEHIHLKDFFLAIERRQSIRVPSFVLGRWMHISWA